MFLADLHIHSTFSDGKHSIPELVDFYGKRGFGAIAITDHLCDQRSFLGRAAHILNRSLTEENFPIYLETIRAEAKRAWKEYRMLVMPGYEITLNTVANSRSAHILVLGLEKFIHVDQDILRMLKEIRELGGFTIAAHPVSTRKLEKQTYFLWERREFLKNWIDAWEVASGPHLFSEVLGSGLPMVANSDLHFMKQIKSWKTVFDCERTREAVFHAIRTQNLQFTFFDEENKHGNLSRRRSFSLGSDLGSDSVCALPAEGHRKKTIYL